MYCAEVVEKEENEGAVSGGPVRFGAVTILGMIAAMAMASPVSGGVTKAGVPTKCPGAFKANQHDIGGARTVWTVAFEDKDKKDKWWPASGSMGVHVVFQNIHAPAQTLEFTVSYLPPGVKMTRTGAVEDDVPELKKSYSMAAHDKVSVEGDLLVGPASSVTRVHLTGVTFSDGSAWQAASEDACSVAPNRVLAGEGKESDIKW